MAKKQYRVCYEVAGTDQDEKKRVTLDEQFPNRQKARNFCRSNANKYDVLRILHPCGAEEVYR